MVQICAKLLIFRLKIGGAITISTVAMTTVTLILFLDVDFKLIAEIIWFLYFLWFSCRQFLFTVCFSKKLREKF